MNFSCKDGTPKKPAHPLAYCEEPHNHSSDYDWIKDKSHVFYKGQKLDSVDVDSFQFIVMTPTEMVIAVDKNFIYNLRYYISSENKDTDIKKYQVPIAGFIAGPFIHKFLNPTRGTRIFADKNGFFASLGSPRFNPLEMNVCYELLNAGAAERGDLKVLGNKPDDISWAFEDNRFQYFFKKTDKYAQVTVINYMIDKQSNKRYPLNYWSGECKEWEDLPKKLLN